MATILLLGALLCVVDYGDRWVSDHLQLPEFDALAVWSRSHSVLAAAAATLVLAAAWLLWVIIAIQWSIRQLAGF